MQRIGKITSALSSRVSFIALTIAFLVHNLEEAITICRYPVENPFPIIQPASCSQFLIAVSLLSAVVLIAFGIAIQTKIEHIYNFISTGLAAAILLNVFLPHFLVANYTFHYTPGLVSAIALNLPLSLLVLIKNRSRYSSNMQFYRQIAYFLVIGYLVFAISMGIAKYLV